MKLPVLAGGQVHSVEGFVRAVKQATLATSEFCGEVWRDEDGCVLIANPARASVHLVNMAYEVRTLPGDTPASVLTRIDSYFRSRGCGCFKWVPAGDAFDEDWREALEARGLERAASSLFVMMESRIPRSDSLPMLQVIPARSMVAPYREFCRECIEAEYQDSHLAKDLSEFSVSTLDDTRLDMLVGRLNGKVVCAGGVYTYGDVGILWDIATHPAHRRQGLMKSLLVHLLEFCGRCQFRQLILETDPENAPAHALYQSIGMVHVTDFEHYQVKGIRRTPSSFTQTGPTRL